MKKIKKATSPYFDNRNASSCGADGGQRKSIRGSSLGLDQMKKTKKRVTSRFFDTQQKDERERIRGSALELYQSSGPRKKTKKRVTPRFFGPQPKDEEEKVTVSPDSVKSDKIDGCSTISEYEKTGNGKPDFFHEYSTISASSSEFGQERRDGGKAEENADNNRRDSPFTSIMPVCESDCIRNLKRNRVGFKATTPCFMEAEEKEVVADVISPADAKRNTVKVEGLQSRGCGRKRRNTKNVHVSLELEEEKQDKLDSANCNFDSSKKATKKTEKRKRTGKVAGDDDPLTKRVASPNENMVFEAMIAKFAYKGESSIRTKDKHEKAGVDIVNGVNRREPEEMKPCKMASIEVQKVSPYFRKVSSDGNGKGKKSKQKRKSATLTKAEARSEAYRRKTPDDTWKPPRSRKVLLQEDHAHDPWRVLVICMLLNCTTGGQVKGVLDEFFGKYPNAQAAAEARVEEMENLIRSLGLKKRSATIKRMSREYLGDEWTHVTQLHGIGKYAGDAHAIFCTGLWEQVKPKDHMLDYYWDFLHIMSRYKENWKIEKERLGLRAMSMQ